MKTKRFLSVLLTLAMIICSMAFLFVTAYAEGTNDIITFSAGEEVDKTPLTFKGTEGFKIKLAKYGSTELSVPTLEYSFDNNTWLTYTPENQIIEVNNTEKTVYFRGSGNNAFSNGGSSYQWKITNLDGDEVTTGVVEASGNINTLLDYNNPPTEFTSSNAYCFYSMFSGCKALKTAPKLPATKLADYCYCQMFRYCSSLTEAPKLPAMTLAKHCYNAMFGGCSALKTAPELPATTLAESCYQGMFSDCTALRTAMAELPANTLENYCYQGMFSGCKSLKTAPQLKATTLATQCYSSMFRFCSKLKFYEVQSADLADWIIPNPATEPNNWCFWAISKTKNPFTLELGKMYRYERPVIPAFANSYDSGFYADEYDSTTKEGIIAFTSQITNLTTDFVGYQFDSVNDCFGIAMFSTSDLSSVDNDKIGTPTGIGVKVSKITFADLQTADGYFYSFIKNIQNTAFDKTAYAIPFAVIDGDTYWGDTVSAKVKDKDGNAKWLGTISNAPSEE